jgi:Bacterial low temperature requirement A protein (LtrA)
MDVIVQPEDEETLVFHQDTTITTIVTPDALLGRTDDNPNVYEYEDMDVHHSFHNSNNDLQSNRSDRMNHLSDLEHSSSRRRINVIASHPVSNHRKKTTTTTASSSLSSSAIAYHPTKRVLYYSPPRQRQKWNETQVVPRVNWGDLFFDLFYVGATYNVSSLLNLSPNGRGLLYTAGTFLPVMNIWMQKTYYDARYVMEDDILHRVLVMFAITFTGITISNIRPIEIMSDADHKPSMFVFTTMLLVEQFFASTLHLEVYLFGVGQPQMKHAAIRDCIFPNVSLPFYIIAMILSAIRYFGPKSDPTHNVDTTTTTTDLPILFCLIGCIVKWIVQASMIILCLPKDGRHKEMYVHPKTQFVVLYVLLHLLSFFFTRR